MKNYVINQKGNDSKFYATNDKNAFLSYYWTDDIKEAQNFTFAEGTKVLDSLNKNQSIGELTEVKINVDDLNGVDDATLKLITKTVQEPNPVKFSLLCEGVFKSINPEALVNYSITVLMMPTSRGNALIYVATFQYWASEWEFNQWIEELSRANLLIKP